MANDGKQVLEWKDAYRVGSGYCSGRLPTECSDSPRDHLMGFERSELAEVASRAFGGVGAWRHGAQDCNIGNVDLSMEPPRLYLVRFTAR